MFNEYSKAVTKIFNAAEAEMIDLKHPYVGSEHLFLSLIKNDEYVEDIMTKYNISYNLFKKELTRIVGKSNKVSEYILYTPLLRRIISTSSEIAMDEGNGVITGRFLLLAILEENDGIAINLLKSLGVNLNKLLDEVGGVATSLLMLNEFGTLMNKQKYSKVIGRDSEVLELCEVLCKKNKCNPLLVGKSGVGKSVIVEEFVRVLDEGLGPKSLEDYKVYSLSLASLISGTKYRGDFEGRLKDIIKEVLDNKVILFIDEIHGIVNCGSAEGAVSAGEILKPYLARGDIKVIGATTEREYSKYMSSDKALLRRFDVIKVSEPSLEMTYDILKGIKKEYENFHQVKVSNEVLKKIINIGDKFLKSKNNPDRSIELLDLICVKNSNKKITVKDVDLIIEDRFGYKLNSDIVKEIESNFKNLIGQDKVKNQLLNLLKYKLNNKSEVVSALLLGNTGVGKSEIVRIIANSFGDNTLLKLDMSEYYLETSINKLIGVSSGYVGYNEYYEFEKVKHNPFTVILVDEVEKASPKVLNLFLSILDDGFIKDGVGEVIDFRNTIIFFTSNLGVKSSVGFVKNSLSDVNEFFAPELLGRFDLITVFDDINEANVKDYVEKLNKTVDIEKILELSDYQKYGLRNVKKVIRQLEIEKSFV